MAYLPSHAAAFNKLIGPLNTRDRLLQKLRCLRAGTHKSGSVIDVRFTPDATKLLRSSEMTRCANRVITASNRTAANGTATRSPRRRRLAGPAEQSGQAPLPF